MCACVWKWAVLTAHRGSVHSLQWLRRDLLLSACEAGGLRLHSLHYGSGSGASRGGKSGTGSTGDSGSDSGGNAAGYGRLLLSHNFPEGLGICSVSCEVLAVDSQSLRLFRDLISSASAADPSTDDKETLEDLISFAALVVLGLTGGMRQPYYC
jgi:hypothetical protein